MKLQNEAWRHRKRRSREEVKRLIDEFEASESDRAEFCRSQGLALSTLQRHLRARRLESADRGGGRRGANLHSSWSWRIQRIDLRRDNEVVAVQAANLMRP
jgi:hypothetical protein